MDNYSKSVLANGLRVVTMAMPQARTVACGVWLGSGARQEAGRQHGAAHFIEHMMFKGTERRSARQLSEEVEEQGGSFNACTAKEKTSYYIRMLDSHAGLALDILSDILLNSRFDPEDIERERQVISEEINSCEDCPEELVFDLHMAAIWPDHPLGRTILGDRPAVAGLRREDLMAFRRQHYLAGNMVLVLAGNIDHRTAVRLAEQYFATVPAGEPGTGVGPPVMQPAITVQEKDLEQVQFCFGVNGLKAFDGRMYILHVLNNILGGGPASRLFQTIREDHGLAYSICSLPVGYRDCGTLVVHGAVRRENFPAVCQLLATELAGLRAGNIADRELHRAKEQIKCSLLMGLESSGAVMNRAGNVEIALGRYLPVDEVLAGIDRVDRSAVVEMAREILNVPAALTVLGGIERREVERSCWW
ncbi:MAG: insulinase family protein [Negativicutes bacterium]|nr:insulinase family protein [Negativicutes bacterium]